MKTSKRNPRFSLSKILFEQEEDEELFDEEPEEEEAEQEGDEGEDADADEKDDAENEKDDSESQEEKVTVADEPSIDGEIQAVLIDFETTARKSAVSENASLHMLYENEELFDLDTFTADVARLVKNYDNLIDMEALLVNKTKEFLEDRYGEEVVSQFLDKLETQHDIEEPTVTSPVPSSNLETPLAVGAGATGE